LSSGLPSRTPPQRYHFGGDFGGADATPAPLSTLSPGTAADEIAGAGSGASARAGAEAGAGAGASASATELAARGKMAAVAPGSGATAAFDSSTPAPPLASRALSSDLSK
jgi:hypothetical protein